MALTKISRSLLDTGVSDSSDATAITIDSSENVGIATTSPSQKLEVTGNVYVGGGNYFTQSTSGYFFGGSGSFTNGVYGVGVNNMAFNVNGSERMRIDSSGIVDITGGTLKLGSGANRRLFYRSANSDVLLEAASGLFYRQDIANTHHSWFTGNSERVRIQSGGGISFNGDTAAANALDDYEEGTYIPTWTTIAGSPVSYRNADNTSNTSTNGLSYVKIGRQVTISGSAFFSSGSSINNQRPFMTLPFAARVYSVSGVMSSYQSGSIEDIHYLNYSAPSSINLFKLNSAGSHVAFGGNGAMELYINITYQTYV